MKRIIMRLVSIGLFVAILLPGVVSAQSTNNAPKKCDVTNDIILPGLWAGANMDLSEIDRNPCIRRDTTSSPGASPVAPSQPAGSLKRSELYIALGDSVAAGLGLPQPTDPTTTQRVCGLTGYAYPVYVAASVNRWYINGSCRSAKASDLFTEQNVNGREQPPQLDTAFANGVPALISVTAGANDLGWNAFLYRCYQSTSTCGTEAEKATLKGLRIALRASIHTSMIAIAAKSGGQPPRVVWTGYYNPLSNNCTNAIPTISQAEINWINSEVQLLNQAIQNTVANYSFARFAPVSFSGHELCTPQPWVQGLNDPAPLHPTVAGQQAISRSVLTKVN
ncbi:MAG: hydrolase family protein [Candidatus Saccharibacteria bacterium]|nr:hydrolase family protein [Candidatus Saccharibacteria bacterium]